jgi:hypothetical protein
VQRNYFGHSLGLGVLRGWLAGWRRDGLLGGISSALAGRRAATLTPTAGSYKAEADLDVMAGAATHGRTAEQVPDDVGRQDGGVGEEEEMSYDLDERVGRLWESGIGLGGAPGLWQASHCARWIS